MYSIDTSFHVYLAICLIVYDHMFFVNQVFFKFDTVEKYLLVRINHWQSELVTVSNEMCSRERRFYSKKCTALSNFSRISFRLTMVRFPLFYFRFRLFVSPLCVLWQSGRWCHKSPSTYASYKLFSISCLFFFHFKAISFLFFFFVKIMIMCRKKSQHVHCFYQTLLPHNL